jgi:uncharacterized membrane protein YoaK (UPF0700 family)
MARRDEHGAGPLTPTLLTVLAFAAGCTDAITYIALGKVFTANMTGNTVLLGIALDAGDASRLGRSACALAGFCVGVVAAGPLLEARGTRRALRIALLGELAALAGLAIAAAALGGGGAHVYWLIALSGFAMGTQSAVVRAAGVGAVATTYITGTLTGLVADVAGRLLGTHDRHSTRAGAQSTGKHLGRAHDTEQPAHSQLRLRATIWSVYLLAALIAAAATDAWGLQATWLAGGAVIVVAYAAGRTRQHA